MPGCSTGRNIQKYKGAAASTLQDVTDNGNTTTGDLITTSGFFIGDGSLLTGIAGASSAFSFQDTSDRGNTTSNTIQFTNTYTSFITSGNIVVAGNVTATDFYGDGTTLTGITLSTDMTSNVIRISNLESNLTANSLRIGSLETDLTSNASRVTNLETYLSDNASRTTSLETELTSNASRMGTAETNISSLETNLSDNSSRITSLETDLTSNASRMGTAETNISSLETDVTSNTARIGNLETDLTSNASRITTVENNVLVSNSSGITSGIGQGDILIGDSTNVLTKLTLGADSHVLTSNTSTGKPEWKSASAIGTTVATLSNSSHIIGGSYNGGSAKTWSLKASTSNSADYIVIRDSNGNINVGALNVGGTSLTSTAWSGSAATLTNARDIGGQSFDGSASINLPGVNQSGNQDTSGNAATATKLATARDIGGQSFDGTASINLPGVNQSGNQDTSGNAATATKLATARNIGGQSFDGTANINLPGVNQAGNQNTSGNAATATKLATARDIGGQSFDGTANINLPGVNQGGNQDTTGKAGSIANASDTTTSSELSVAFLNGNQVKTNTNLTFKPNSNELKLNNLKITGSLTAGNSTGSSGQVLKSTGTGVEWGTDATGGSGGTTVWTKDTSTNEIYYNTAFVGINKTNPGYRLDVGGDINLTGGLYVSGSSGTNGQVLKSTGTGLTWGTDNTGGSGGTSVWSQSGSTPNFIINTPTPESKVGIAIPTNQAAVNQTLHIGSNVIVNDTGNYDVLRVNGNVFCTNYLFGDGSKIRNLNTIRTETGGNQISIGGNDGGPVLSWRERQIRYQQGSNRPDPPNYGF